MYTYKYTSASIFYSIIHKMKILIYMQLTNIHKYRKRKKKILLGPKYST